MRWREVLQGFLIVFLIFCCHIAPVLGDQTNSVFDRNHDDDVDGNDLVNFIDWFRTESLSDFAAVFGRNDLSISNSPGLIVVLIDHTKIEEDLVNFPTMIHLGSISGVVEYDISHMFDVLQNDSQKLVVTDVNNNPLFTEVEYWDSGEKEAVLYVKVPEISANQDTKINIFYDASAPNNSEYTGHTGSLPARTVWGTEFRTVYHMAQNPAAGTNSLLDSTSYQNHATPYGSMTSNDLVDGKSGKGLDFDGADDRLQRAHNSSLALPTYSIGTLFKVDSLTEFQTIVNKDYGWRDTTTSYNANYEIRVSNDKVQARFENTAGDGPTITSNQSINANQWYYVVATFRSSDRNFKLYVNGELDNSMTAAHIPNTANTQPLRIGRYYGSRGWDGPLSGVIDELAISSDVKSAAWVKASFYSLFDDLIIFSGDIDRDGISDYREMNYYGSNPYRADSDLDGINDYDEIIFWGNLWSQDADNDSVINLLDPDSDNDGLTDGEEKDNFGTDPLKADSDRDGIADGDESSYWGADWNADPDGDNVINLLDWDSDNDGIADGSMDDDLDAMSDWWEILHFNNLDQEKDGDFDSDGFSNYFEFKLDTLPTDASDRPASGTFYKYDAMGRIKEIFTIN